MACLSAYGQAPRPLSYYVQAAQERSPLITDLTRQTAIQQLETERLRALYTHARVELSGEYLMVPIVSRDGGKTQFKTDAQSADSYYGYDLGESSSHLHAGVSWTQPLLGGGAFRTARQVPAAERDIAAHRLRLERHELERTVTEHYLLCLLDQRQTAHADSALALIERQQLVVQRLTQQGLTRQTDLELLRIEHDNGLRQRLASVQAYRSHLADLNLLCGIADTSAVTLTAPEVSAQAVATGPTMWAEQYRLDSLSAEAQVRQLSIPYRPRLDFFANAGMQTGRLVQLGRRVGWSAGLTLSWTLWDGRQRRYRERQLRIRQGTLGYYEQRARLTQRIRLGQCRDEMESLERQAEALRSQMGRYEQVLALYSRQIAAGQLSVLDYITILRAQVKARQDLDILQTNQQLAAVAYNYWNW